MAGILSSVKKFVISLVLLIIGIAVAIFSFDQLVIESIVVRQYAKVATIIASSSVVFALTRYFSSRLRIHADPHVAAAFSFFAATATVMVAAFATLHVFQVPVNTLLIGGGFIALTMGFIGSTLVGNVLAGTLLLLIHPFKVGDSVLVNNSPGRVEEITGMFTKIRNEAGGETVFPNSAIVQGGVVVTKLPSEGSFLPKLPYVVGDRIYTTYIGGRGVVKAITAFHTKILLDSDMEVTIPNNSVIMGTIQVAKVRDSSETEISFSLKVDWNAEEAIKAIKDAAVSDPKTFKSPMKVYYSSLDGKTVELKVSCIVDPSKKDEAKNVILRTAYLSKED